MDYKTLLGLTSAIVGAGIVVAQDPSFEYPPVQPIINSSKDKNSFGQQKRITVRFNHASAEEVLDWLGNQGVNFVTAGAPKGVKVDLNVSDTPLDDVIDAVGEALGGAFVQRGNTYIFQKGLRIMRSEDGSRSGGEGFNMPSVRLIDPKTLRDGINFTPFLSDEESFSFFTPQDPKTEKEMKELHERMMKEFGPDGSFMKEMQKEFGDPKKWDAYQKKMMEQFGPNSKFHRDLMKQFGDGSAFQKNMKVWGEQDSKKWEDFGKQMEKRFGPGSAFEKNMKVWGEQDSKKWEDFGKQMEKHFGPGSEFEKGMKVWSEKFGRDMEKRFGEGSDFAKSMKSYKLENGKMRELSEKEREQIMKDLEKKMKDLDMKVVVPPIPRMPDMPKMPDMNFKMPKMPDMPAMADMGGAFRSADIAEVAKTLTPAQREKNKRQGFLYWSDLTREQQAKLGVRNWSGDWSITYSRDGESFTLKSDRK